jgi:hypothetical protein
LRRIAMRPVHDPSDGVWSGPSDRDAGHRAFHRGHPDEALRDPELRRWVSNQREVYGRSTLSPDRVERFEELGFEWDPRSALWEKRFSELVRFMEEHDHCNVPMGGENSELRTWVSTQRTRAKKSVISDEQRRRLEEIGFRF